MHLLDSVSYCSRLNKNSPSAKVVFSVGSLIFCVTASSVIIASVIFITMVWGTIYFNKLKINKYIHLLSHPMLFIMISSVTLVFNITKQPLNLVAIPIGAYYISASNSSILYGMKIIMIATSSVSCLYFLVLSTPVLELLKVMKKMHVPSLVIELMLLIYRFIFILLQMAESISTAQKCRLGRRNFKTSIKSLGSLLSALFIRAIKKADKIYDAMEARGYQGTIIGVMELKRAKKKEIAFIATYFLFLFLLQILSNGK